MKITDKFVAMDIDGVLADFEGFLVEYLDSVFTNLNHNRHEYDLKKRYPVKEVLDCAIRFVEDPNAYYGVSPNEGAFKFLSELDDNNIPILLMTSRPVLAERFTIRWIKREIGRWMPFEGLLGVKFTLNKSAFLFEKKDKLAFLVDDNPEEVLEAQKLGMTAYSWAQPWNEHVFPKLFSTRDGHTMYQKDENTDPVYFWGEETE